MKISNKMALFIFITVLILIIILLVDHIFQSKQKKKNHSEKPVEQPQKANDAVSVLGESRFDRCQLMPNDAKPEESKDSIDDNTLEGNNFGKSNSQDEENYDPEPMDIDVPPLERIDPDEEVDLDEEDEILELFGKDAVIASGLSVEEMIQTNQVIENPESTSKEEDNAGRILYQNKETDMFDQIASGSPVRLERIRTLMYLHEKKHRITEDINGISASRINTDLESFDIGSYVR